MASLARILLVLGAIIFVTGGLLLLADRLGLRHLPGTFAWRRDSFTVYVPVGLMAVVSVVLSVILTLLTRR
jgi:hypothetical protein